MRLVPLYQKFTAEELAAEMINYQDTTIFKALVLALTDIYNQIPKEFDTNKRQNEQMLETIINNGFKSNGTFDFNDEYPCVRIFDEYHNSTLIRNSWREFLASEWAFVKRFTQAGTSVRGGVNINTAQLSGLFSELPFTISLPIEQLKHGDISKAYLLTPEEMAAVILHEVGHFFTYCEAFFRTVSTNLALSGMSKDLDGASNAAEREIVIARCVADLKLQDVNVKALAATGNKAIVETAIVVETVEKTRSELGVDNVYDTVSAEFLADQFATRMGGGRHIVTGLDKLHRMFGSGETSYSSTPEFVLRELFGILFLFIPPINFVTIPLTILTILLGGGDEEDEGMYDIAPKRYGRIKADLVNRLKNRKIGDEERKRILADIEEIDKRIAPLTKKIGVTDFIATYLIPVYRRRRKSRELQQELEAIATNPLFIRSAELASIS